MNKVHFSQYGEINSIPDNSYEIVYAPKNDRAFKIKKDFYKYKEINVSADELLAIGSTPIELLPAAGTNKYYEWYAYIEYTFGTIAYTMGSPFSMQQGTINKMPFGMLATASEDTVAIVRPSFGIGIAYYFCPNQALRLSTLSGADPADGDGTIKVRLYYKTITFKK